MKLLLVDVQNFYSIWFNREYLSEIRKIASLYSEVHYLWDISCEEELEDQLPEDLADMEIKPFAKKYYFIRDLIQEIGETKTVEVLRYCIKAGIKDYLDLEKNYQDFTKSFPKLKIKNIEWYLPEYLMSELRQRDLDGCHVAGGALKECLLEISVLMNAMNIPHTILKEHTF